MILTRGAICEQIQRRLANGSPSADFEPTLDEINSWLTHGIAAAAMKSYTDAVQIDGVESVPDGFYTTHKNLPIVLDATTSLFKVNLPTAVYGLPRGYDINAAWIVTNNRLGATLIRVSEKQLGSYQSLKRPVNAILFWAEGSTLIIDSLMDISTKKLAVRMAGSTAGLDDNIAVPPDYHPYLIEYVMRWFGPSVSQPQDTVNDAQNIK